MAWTNQEVAKLRQLYPSAEWSVIEAALPHHDKSAIAGYAHHLKLRRSLQRPVKRHPLISELRTLRLTLGLSCRDVAQRMMTDRTVISARENGKAGRLPSGAFLEQWAAALGRKLAIVEK